MSQANSDLDGIGETGEAYQPYGSLGYGFWSNLDYELQAQIVPYLPRVQQANKSLAWRQYLHPSSRCQTHSYQNVHK